jgi:hypothetical protein
MCDLEFPLLLKGEINMGYGGSCGGGCGFGGGFALLVVAVDLAAKERHS